MIPSRPDLRRFIQPLEPPVSDAQAKRLHANFVEIQQMTNRDGVDTLRYSLHATAIGLLVIASTSIGLCHVAFVEGAEAAEADLTRLFPHACLRATADAQHGRAVSFIKQDTQGQQAIMLHVAGTDFQINVWQALLKIPTSTLCTYAQIAETVGRPKATRAVGSAIGANPAAFLIPCHRVVRGDGDIGGFKWGQERKFALIERETKEYAA